MSRTFICILSLCGEESPGSEKEASKSLLFSRRSLGYCLPPQWDRGEVEVGNRPNHTQQIPSDPSWTCSWVPVRSCTSFCAGFVAHLAVSKPRHPSHHSCPAHSSRSGCIQVGTGVTGGGTPWTGMMVFPARSLKTQIRSNRGCSLPPPPSQHHRGREGKWDCLLL